MLWTILLVALILAVADLLIVSLSILQLIFAGVLFGIFLNGVSAWVTRHTPLSYNWSLTAFILLLAAMGVGGIYYLGSQVAEQAAEFWSQLQSALQQASERFGQQSWVRRFLPQASDVQSNLSGGKIVPEVLKGVRWIGWGLTGMLVIFFVGLYAAFDPDLYKTGLVKLVPPDRRGRITEVLRQLNSALGHWIIGRLISMCIVGVATAIGLWLLKVPLPITLGVLAALLTFIPNIGPVLAAVPQALLAVQVGSSTVLYVILFNVALQTVESYLITPLVQRYEVSLPPAVTIFVQLLMAVLTGVIGVMMAAPMTVAIMVSVQMLYIQDRLGDPAPGRLVSGH